MGIASVCNFTPRDPRKALTSFRESEDSGAAFRRFFPPLSPVGHAFDFVGTSRGSPIFPSFFCHGRRHKNLPSWPEKKTFRRPGMAQYWLCSCGPLSPKFTGWTQDLVFDFRFDLYLLLTRRQSPLSFGVFGGVEFQVPSGPSERLSSRELNPRQNHGVWDRDLLVPGVKNLGSNRCQIRASGLDEVGWVRRVEHRRRTGTGPPETKGRC